MIENDTPAEDLNDTDGHLLKTHDNYGVGGGVLQNDDEDDVEGHGMPGIRSDPNSEQAGFVSGALSSDATAPKS